MFLFSGLVYLGSVHIKYSEVFIKYYICIIINNLDGLIDRVETQLAQYLELSYLLNI